MIGSFLIFGGSVLVLTRSLSGSGAVERGWAKEERRCSFLGAVRMSSRVGIGFDASVGGNASSLSFGLKRRNIERFLNSDGAGCSTANILDCLIGFRIP